MANAKLLAGEHYLLRTVDDKLALTTHRVIRKRRPWDLRGSQSIMLEDILKWEMKTSGKSAYLCFSVASALLVYFNDSFALISGFFLMLYIMTRHRRIHIVSPDTVLVLPLEVEETRIGALIQMVKQAKKERVAKLKTTATTQQPTTTQQSATIATTQELELT